MAASTEQTPRYRNFSNNMPTSRHPNAIASKSLITVEKEPEPNPEDQCFMCRQSNVYVKPIGMNQQRRVAQIHPPPLSRAQIEQLSQKKNLTKQEARKLLQCYFPEIKHVKYFQLHKFHSCCYDPKHLNLCKNHITALQREREQNPGHHHHDDDNPYGDYERDGDAKNRVSFVRIKIEPTKGIPTRFLGPTALPESLADMLVKQVNRLENKKMPPSSNVNQMAVPYNVRRVNMPRGSDNEENDNGEEEEDDDDYDDDDDDGQGAQVHGKIMAESSKDREIRTLEKLKLNKRTDDHDLVVEDLDQFNRLYIDHDFRTNAGDSLDLFANPKKKKRKKIANNTTPRRNRKPKLKHWEILAMQQVKQEACNCRHQVMHVEDDQVHYDWCRCKDHQHRELIERRKSLVPPVPPPLPPPPPPVVPPQETATPAPKRRPKPRRVRKRSIGIDAAEPSATEIALAYDPSAVDYDMIQEVIYYRTSSGRLIKPETTNAFSYQNLPSNMMINNVDSTTSKAEVLYMTPDGKLRPYESGKRNGDKRIILSKPGSFYNGQAVVDTQHSTSNNKNSNTLPVLKLPPVVNSPAQQSNNYNGKGYQTTEFTLATFSPTQKSSKPTVSNQEPTPDFGRDSTVLANRRWFDQPLGDQDLRPVRDGQYGLIAGTSTDEYPAKMKLAESQRNARTNPPNNQGNCTIS